MAWETSSLQALGTTRSSNGRPELPKGWLLETVLVELSVALVIDARVLSRSRDFFPLLIVTQNQVVT